jgi:hypothetical protein
LVVVVDAGVVLVDEVLVVLVDGVVVVLVVEGEIKSSMVVMVCALGFLTDAPGGTKATVMS